ncbi:MAG: hypothetical protein LH480_03030 [Rubrivivax sp.]|nr:hypothetical protein [Rubrivivax sp.]
MKNLLPLMQREWLQHRMAWALLMLLPLAIALLPLMLANIQIESDLASRTSPDLALILGTLSIVVTAAVIFLLLWVTSLFITSGVPRRDHADRSVEFWLSLPTGHAESFVAPLLVHLVLVPAAALVVGLLGGYAISAVLVTRFVGIGEWLALPWALVLSGTGALVLRVMAGLPLAALWLMPLVLLAMLANALFKRWGLPVLAVGLGLGSVLLQQVFGQPLLGQVLAGLGNNAARSLMGASGQSLEFTDRAPLAPVLASVPQWAGNDLLAAVRDLANPLFIGAMAVSAALFTALVLWRQRGAGVGGG